MQGGTAIGSDHRTITAVSSLFFPEAFAIGPLIARRFWIVETVVIAEPAGVGSAFRPSRYYSQIFHSYFWPVITKCEHQRVGTIGRAHAALPSALFGLNLDAAARIELVPVPTVRRTPLGPIVRWAPRTPTVRLGPDLERFTERPGKIWKRR